MNQILPITPVILCGGSGTRLWPRSRVAKPKPFLPLVGETTLFEDAIERCAGFNPPVVVAGPDHVAHIEAQYGAGSALQLVVEPESKNTAAAIALAALRLPEDAILLVCPSDHHIADIPAFRATAGKAAQLAADGWLVSFGIEATGPETGYGYLRRGEPIGDLGFKTAQFVEKPDLARATEFLAQGDYCWNGGIFAFRARDFLDELETHRPMLATKLYKSFAAGHEQGNRFYPDAKAFAQIQGESVDYAVMELTDKAALVPVSMGWSDIGNWEALRQARSRDADGNTIYGQAELVDCRNVLVESDGPRVSVIGLEGVIVVVDGDEVLVTTAAGAQKVGKLSGATDQ
jgi:mannose-1-phosphate guanylyltransferase